MNCEGYRLVGIRFWIRARFWAKGEILGWDEFLISYKILCHGCFELGKIKTGNLVRKIKPIITMKTFNCIGAVVAGTGAGHGDRCGILVHCVNLGFQSATNKSDGN